MNTLQYQKGLALIKALTSITDRDIYLSRYASQSLREFQDAMSKVSRCDDYGRCNCLKGYCDKGLKND